MTAQPPGNYPPPPPGNMPPPPPGGYPPPPPPASGGFPPPAGEAPSNNLVLGILVTLFCCLPFGVVSIIKASQVSGLWASGQYMEAKKSAADAKKWAMWGLIAGLVVIVILVILNFAGVAFYETSNSYEY